MAKVMLSIPDELLSELDRAAKERHKKRSELFKDLALQFLRGEALPPYRPNIAATAPTVQEAFEKLREFKIELEPGETAEGLIREMREAR